MASTTTVGDAVSNHKKRPNDEEVPTTTEDPPNKEEGKPKYKGTPRQGNKKKTKKEAAKNQTWRRNNYDNNDDSRNNESPNGGSFANPDMREQFGVTVEELNENQEAEEEGRKKVKKKVAFLVGFLGTKYGGFQINPGQRSLQAEIELALFRCGMISLNNFGFAHKYGWSNSARTDKGVHAAAQVCSCKIELPSEEWELSDNLETARQRLDAKLPSDVTILDMERVTRSFCAKTQRDRVRYQYMVPSFLLHPDWIGVLKEQGVDLSNPNERLDNKRPMSEEEAKKVQSALKGYRSSHESRKLLQDALRKYEGTNFFHNFTKGLSPGQASARRFIECFRVQDRVVVNDVEWIPTQVLGQSFLLHQIRKMIGVAIDVARGAVPLETMDKALSEKDSMIVNVAPAQGLFLEMSYFTGYNRRKEQSKDLNDLDWDKDGPAKERWIAFRDIIRRHIFEEEQEQATFVQYMFQQDLVFDCRKSYGVVES
jgi:tRNA pseudouridine(38-40) synthase